MRGRVLRLILGLSLSVLPAGLCVVFSVVSLEAAYDRSRSFLPYGSWIWWACQGAATFLYIIYLYFVTRSKKFNYKHREVFPFIGALLLVAPFFFSEFNSNAVSLYLPIDFNLPYYILFFLLNIFSGVKLVVKKPV